MSKLTELRDTLRASVKRDGPYKLSAGGTSDWYLDCRPTCFARPDLIGRVVAGWILAWDNIWDPDQDSIVIAGVELGGVPIAVAASMSFNQILSWERAVSVAVRPEPKQHGVQSCVVGETVMPGAPKVIVVDDVFTTGNSIAKASMRIQDQWNVEPIGILTLFNRHEKLQNATRFAGIPYTSVFNLDDLL